MTEFQTALARFLSGELDLPGLEETLARTLQADPSSAESSLQALDHMFRSSRLAAKTYIDLKQKIPPSGSSGMAPPEAAAPATGAPPPIPNAEVTQPPTVPGGVSPTPPAPAPSAPANTGPVAPPGDTGGLRGADSASPPAGSSSPILDILQPGGPPGEPPPAADAASPESRDAPPSDERTVFRQVAPAGAAQPSGAATGAPAPTGGFTGGLSLPTGQTGTGTGTGTGSNWTDPSRWGAGPAPTMQPGSILKDRYVLEVVIGRGGMGVVFKAKDLRREEAQDRNPYVAVKILNDEFRRHPESLKALQRESRKAQDLAHPNIVTVFDFDRDGPIVYMTMEYLEGKSLDRLAKSASFDGMPMDEAYPMIEGLGLALAYAHGKGIVHSDFKPANVFLTHSGDIKVFDFGIARAAKLPDDKAGDMTLFDPGSLGALTPAYASCEMLDGEEPDPRDDIYALACLTYELLTGQHPFARRSAAEARDNKIPLTPVKNITRRQWRGIQRGLAFRRADRSPNVNAYLDDIRPRKINKSAAGLAAAAVVVLAGIGIVFVPTYLEGRRIDNLIALISSSSMAEMPEAIEQLGALNAEEQDTVRGNSGVRSQLVEFYVGQITAAQNALDYPLAETFAETGMAVYPDSNQLISARDRLATEKAALLSDLLTRFNSHLESGRLLPDEGDDITDVLADYRKIDPTNDSLVDPRLATAYAAAAERALATDVSLAERYVDEWARRFPDDSQLPGLRDRVNTIRDVRDRDARVAELQQQLTPLLGTLGSPEDVLAVESDLLQLQALAPNNALIASFRDRAEALTAARVAQLTTENDWVGAERQLASMQQLISAEFRAAESAVIGDAQAAYGNRIDGILAAITSAVENGELARAEAALVELTEAGGGPRAIRAARTGVSRGYLDGARAARAANDFAEASALIEAGSRADPVFTDWQLELAEIDNAREAFESGVVAQNNLERINELTAQIEASLTAPALDVETARQTLATIDELGRIAPSAALSVSGRGRVAEKLVATANALGFDAGRWDDAVEMATQAVEILPGEPVLRQARQNLLEERNNALARVAAAEEENLRANLDRLLAAPNYGNSGWESELRSNIQSLAPLAGAAEFLQGKRAEIARSYLQEAETLLAQNRFAIAEQRLDSSEWFVPGFDPAADLRQRLSSARAAFEAENKSRELAAEIDGLKRTFATNLNAERVPDARTVLAQLKQKLPANDSFVMTEAPQMIAGTFLQMAERAVTGERFDTAEQLAEQGLREVANHPGLTALLAKISDARLATNLASLENLLATGSPGDPSGPRNMLAQIRNDAGAGFAEIDSNLRALATERIAATRANRDELISWVDGIFDNFTPPQAVGPACTSNMAMAGRRARGQCYDFLPDTTTSGPRLVVIPGVNNDADLFAITRQEISVGQWNDYCRISRNCAPVTGSDDQVPITGIELSSALAYASWLTASTGHTYRLPTEAEWIKAATADGNAGVSPNCLNPQAGTGDRLLEVNRGGQNAWGVMNYIGNAQEWVRTASGDLVARGGAFRDRLGNCTIETSRPHSGAADDMTGFRLVRDGVEGS